MIAHLCSSLAEAGRILGLMEGEARRALKGDLLEIARCVEAAYSKYIPRLGRRPAPMFADYGALIEAGVVFVIGTPPVATVTLTAKQNALWVDNLAVDPAYQGGGLGRLLMQFAENEARQRALAEIRLYTNELMTENIAFYTGLGYEECERREEEGYRRVFFRKDAS